MKHIGKWMLLLNKRLYKKVTFLLILLLIPVLVMGYGSAAQEESGILTIALAQKGDDPMAMSVMQELKNGSNLLRFVLCNSPDAAKAMINDGKADAAWIFPEDMEEKVYRFVKDPSPENAFIRVVEQSDSIPLKLAREKLSGAVFRHCSKALYISYIRETFPELDNLSDEALMAYYDNFGEDINLFEFSYLDSEGGAQDSQKANYLLAPVRGLLAVVITLGGLAAAMYYIHDDRSGTFSLVPQKSRAAVEFSCQMIAVLNIAFVVLIALILSGLAGHLGKELLILLLYAVCVSLFSMTVRRLCGKLSAVGPVLPLLVVVMLVACPVFFDLGEFYHVQLWLPPTYYVNALYSDRYLVMMCLYSLVLLGIYTLSGKLLHRK